MLGYTLIKAMTATYLIFICHEWSSISFNLRNWNSIVK